VGLAVEIVNRTSGTHPLPRGGTDLITPRAHDYSASRRL